MSKNLKFYTSENDPHNQRLHIDNRLARAPVIRLSLTRACRVHVLLAQSTSDLTRLHWIRPMGHIVIVFLFSGAKS